MKIKLLNSSGKKLKDIDLAENVFGLTPNQAVVHQVVKAQLAGKRSGTADTKTRSEVRGGGKKPWRQKGTGRARAGSSRSPLWKGGGTVFGPTPRNYGQKVPKKVAKLALRSIISAKAKDNSLLVVDELKFAKPSTKEASRVISELKIPGKLTVILSDSDEAAVKSFRNLRQAQAITVRDVNAYDMVNCSTLVFTKEAFDWVSEVLSKP